MDYLEGEDKPCWVYAEGAWREGWILGDWYKVEGRWRARVEWSDGPGLTHRTSFWDDDLRPRDK